MFATCFQFLITKTSLRLRKYKTRNYAIYFLEMQGKILTHVKVLKKFIFSFSSYNLNDHEKSVFCKHSNFAIPPNAIEYLEFLLLLKCYLEKLPAWVLVIQINNVSKKDFEIAFTHYLSRFPGYLTKILPERRLKHWIKQLKIKTQLLKKQTKVIILLFLT